MNWSSEGIEQKAYSQATAVTPSVAQQPASAA